MGKDIESIQVSFVGLLHHNNIERIVIPIIQRDYAQGRVNEQDVRDNFLDSLRAYLEDKSNASHDLDFVYGNINSDKEFIPLDGQQRLTTLFLLHYYLSIHDGKYDSFKSIFISKDGSPKFVYQTRNTSSDFCKALVNNPLDANSLGTISRTIKERCPWFSISWTYDPTVFSMLNMLDSIDMHFSDTNNLYERLIDGQSPAITFRALFMEKSGLKDDLYIKMNSRGLELSPFENLKARIIQSLKSYTEKTYSLKRSDSKPAELVTPKDYFSFKIDIDWSNLFWVYKKKRSRQTDDGESYEIWDIDTPMINFISIIALDYLALKELVTNEDVTNYDNLKWRFYSKLDREFYLHLIEVFDLFYHNAILDELSPNAGICNKLEGQTKFNVRETFQNFLGKYHKDAAYDEHIRLFAYYQYLIHHKGDLDLYDFKQWMRIVMNLTSNSTWQDVKDFCRAMQTIQYLIEKNKQGIIKLLAEDGPKLRSTGFSPMQFHEECIKACLLYRPDASEWEKRIEKVESNGYLRGQILCLLSFSGIEDYYINYNNCSWTGSGGYDYFNTFDKYTDLLWLVFDESGLKKELETNQIFRRALLSYGNYCMPRGNRYSFVINQSRDYSWRRYLQAENDNESKTRRHYFKELLDGYAKDMAFSEYLQRCIERITVDMDDWRTIMVAEPLLWERLGADLFTCFDNDNIYLLSAKTMGGWHCEIRSMFLCFKLKCDPIEDYQWSQNWETFPTLTYKNKNGVIFTIRYQNNKWYIAYKTSIESSNNEIIKEPNEMGFVLCDDNTFELTLSNIDSMVIRRLDDVCLTY